MPDEYKKLDQTESWDETDRTITQMGYFGCRPRFLEVFNKPSIFTAVFSISNLFMVMAYSVISILIPTLESVFNLSSTQTSFILMANDISGTVAAVIMANYCSARKTRWIGIGIMVVFIATVLPASSHFIVQYPQPTTDASLGPSSPASLLSTCNSTTSRASQTQNAAAYAEYNHKYYVLFVLGSLLQGIGGTPPGIAGSTYMDEIFTQKQFGIAISVLYVTAFVGYPISMVFGAKLLSIYVTLGDPPEGVTMRSKEWVGAWWLGLLIPAVAVFITSFVIALYPRQMPAAKRVLQEKVKRGITTVREKTNELNRSLKEITKDLLPAYKRILKKKPFVFLLLSDIFLFLHYGAYTYYPKLFSLLFRLDAREVGSILGIANIIGFSVGLILGGVITRWKNWSAKKLQLIYSVISTIGIPFVLAGLLYCPVDTYAGVDVHYYPDIATQSPWNSGAVAMSAACNSECSCTTAFYNPVCDGGITYFSPCHAGCADATLGAMGQDKLQVPFYSNCTCTESGTATHGACGTTCTQRLYLAMALSTVGTAIGFAGFAAHAIVYQRIVAEADRTAAQGLRQAATRILGTLPAPLIFGYLLDSTCLVWRRTSKGDQGNCWIYDLDRFIWWFMCLQIFFKLSTALFCWFCWWTFPDTNVPTDSHQPLENMDNGHDTEKPLEKDLQEDGSGSGSLVESL